MTSPQPLSQSRKSGYHNIVYYGLLSNSFYLVTFVGDMSQREQHPEQSDKSLLCGHSINRDRSQIPPGLAWLEDEWRPPKLISIAWIAFTLLSPGLRQKGMSYYGDKGHECTARPAAIVPCVNGVFTQGWMQVGCTWTDWADSRNIMWVSLIPREFRYPRICLIIINIVI